MPRPRCPYSSHVVIRHLFGRHLLLTLPMPCLPFSRRLLRFTSACFCRAFARCGAFHGQPRVRPFEVCFVWSLTHPLSSLTRARTALRLYVAFARRSRRTYCSRTSGRDLFAPHHLRGLALQLDCDSVNVFARHSSSPLLAPTCAVMEGLLSCVPLLPSVGRWPTRIACLYALGCVSSLLLLPCSRALLCLASWPAPCDVPATLAAPISGLTIRTAPLSCSAARVSCSPPQPSRTRLTQTPCHHSTPLR